MGVQGNSLKNMSRFPRIPTNGTAVERDDPTTGEEELSR
jgi:hypothetical protein